VRTKPTVLLAGSGRLAKHLKFWNSLNSSPLALAEWNRSQSSETFQSLAQEATHIWLAVSDSAIADLCGLVPAGKSIVHFSGAINVKGAACAHPLMSFPNELLTAEVYPNIHFAITGAGTLDELLPGFSNPFTSLSAEKKAYYHALCVLAGNFPQLIWSRTQKQMQELSIPEEAFQIYIKQITENFIRLGESAVTGPLVRRDVGTIEKNISALDRDPALKNIYSAFVREFSK
jgi:predicted short-subunit dehydrogenase-like oxidoreductase (DUF2520 family)